MRTKLEQKRRTHIMQRAGFWAYGRHGVAQLLASCAKRVRHVLATHQTLKEASAVGGALQEAALAPGVLEVVSPQQLDRLLPGAVHQGVAAWLDAFPFVPLDTLLKEVKSFEEPLFVVLDQVQDPHNVGAIARSALALGAHAIIVAKDNAAPVGGTAFKASAGALGVLPVAQVVNIARALESLKKAGFRCVGTAADAPLTVSACTFFGPTVLVVGAEGQGMRRLVAERCDETVRIDVVGADSLNVSVAVGICLYAAAQRRIARASAPTT